MDDSRWISISVSCFKGMGDLVNAVEKLALSKDGKAERHDQQ
jgi:hypothetical protein